MKTVKVPATKKVVVPAVKKTSGKVVKAKSKQQSHPTLRLKVSVDLSFQTESLQGVKRLQQ